ncbi:hypothetical protein [Nostoc sp.]
MNQVFHKNNRKTLKSAAAFVLSSPGGEVALKKGTNIKLQLKSAIGTTQ